MANKDKIFVLPVQGTKGVVSIDPNAIMKDGCPEPRYVAQDDLMIYVEVRAFMNAKSKFLDFSGAKEYEELRITKGVFYTSAKARESAQKDKKFFTTDWTEMFDAKKPYDVEGFGINSIDIEINASLVPKVHIEFVDVRGKNLLERGNSPDNPYNVFYTFPYPLFEIVLKGYYGKAIRMPLIMEKAITRLDPSTGNYIISADFKSWTFAILNDLILLYAMIVPFMYPNEKGYRGQELVNQKYKEYFDNAQKNATDSTSLNQISLYKIFFLNQSLPKIIGDAVKNEDRAKVNAYVDQMLQGLTQFRSNVATLVVQSPTSQTALKTFVDDTNALMHTSVRALSQINYKDLDTLPIDEVFKVENYWGKDSNGVEGVKPMDDVLYNKINEPITTFRNNQVGQDVFALRKALQNGMQFIPSIRNVVLAIVVHLDAFMELLKEKTQEVYTEVTKKTQTAIPADANYEIVEYDDKGNYWRLPWPEYYNTSTSSIGYSGYSGTQTFQTGDREYIKDYPGNSTNPEVRGWGEVKFIDEMYEAIHHLRQQIGLAEMGLEYWREVFVPSPLVLRRTVDGSMDNFFFTTEGDYAKVVNKILAEILMTIFHNGLLYKQTIPTNTIDSGGVYDYFVTNIITSLFASDQVGSDVLKLIKLLQNTFGTMGSLAGYQTYMEKNANSVNAILSSSFSDQTDKRILEAYYYAVGDKYLPTPEMKTKYLDVRSVQAVAMTDPDALTMSPMGVKYHPKALTAFNGTTDNDGLFAFNTPTEVVTGDVGSSTKTTNALIFTNNYQKDDIFITRQY